ncbi:cytoskeleton-associated protein 2 isoform X2 [Solea solea]|uniref:cytoskeleton-associated protein 2 isoform X2 n=1 Tax=Solea solea TaxID=90069 RepID=UPI00272C0853|nr:cytoskeleton-associated protein 2 isoform X2 [Solea solea]
MDNVAVLKRNRDNKENAQPAYGRDKTSVAPFHLKSKNKDTEAKNGPLKAKVKETGIRSMSSEPPKKVKTAQKIDKGVSATAQRTHSQAFIAKQATKHKKMVAEAPKPPAAVPSSKSAPGMYKGKIVQSKIGSIWKSSTSLDRADPKTENQRDGNVSKQRSKSVDLPQCGTRRPAPSAFRSASSRPPQVAKPAVASRPPAVFHSACLTARTVPATLTSISSRNRTVAATKGSGTLTMKPKVPVTDKKVSKPPVTSSLSHYRLNMETDEERRAKLADWLAAKGKTRKRPAMAAAAPSNTRVSKPGVDLRSQSRAETLPALHSRPEPEPRLEARKAADCADTQEVLTGIATPVFINSAVELLESSGDVSGVDDIVVNLCEALEAMATPSHCSDVVQEPDECSGVEMEDNKPNEVQEKEEVASDTEESDENVVESDDEDDDDDDDEEEENDSDDVAETTPEVEDASVVKYSVKTTPYLQSVKKTIEGEVSTSRKKSNIKDLKFLTPVRRSTRIHRISSRMPMMLVDHDPCVSSLAELVKLDDDPNAYIYRKNLALLEDLPDEPRL